MADLLEVTGFTTAQQSFTFESQIVNPAIFAGNKNSTLRNTAALYSGSKKLNEASKSVTFVSKMLSKEMLKRGYLGDPAAGVNDHTAAAAEGFDYQDKSVIFRLSINADGLDLTNMENAAGELLGKATVIDTLPEGWEFADIVDGPQYLIFAGEQSGNTVRATGEPLDPDELAGFSAAFGATEDGKRTATFTFEPLAQPYVILLKARPGDDILPGYFDSNKSSTERNNLSLHTDKWDPGISTHRDVTAESTYLDKTHELPAEGVLKWIVDYRPYDLPLGGTKLFDKLPAGLELRTDAGGNLLLEGNITAHEWILQDDGSYQEGDEITPLVIGDNITYERDNRELTFMIPDESKAYRFTYITDITGEPRDTIINTVVLCGETEEQGEASGRYTISDRDGWATLQRNGWMEITKIDGSSGALLAGAEYTLYAADGETILRREVTGPDGTLRFKVIPDGEYIFRETAPPPDYTAEEREHTFFVEKVGGNVTVSIDGNDGTDPNRITIKNYREGTAGNLTLTKMTAGNGAETGRRFDFTVDLEDAGARYDYYGSGGAPDGTISSGGTVSLAHGESITITGLPKGMEYTIVEGDYREHGYVTTTDGAEVGDIAADETVETTFTNTRNVGSLTITKMVAGNGGDYEKAFTFKVEFIPPEGMPLTYSYSGVGVPAGTLTSGETISLAHGQSITFEELPAGTGYIVTEDNYIGDEYVSEGLIAEGDITTGVESVAGFTNTRNVGSLTITKMVAGNGGDYEKEFAFKVEFTPPAGMPELYTYTRDGDPESESEISSGDIVTLSHGQSITIADLPEGSEYRITEMSYADEGYITVVEGERGIITVGDDDGGVPEFFALFTNTRNVGSLTISKTVEGDAGDRDLPFTFIIEFSRGGSYSYGGSKEGVIESGGKITLKDGEYVVIEDLLVGTTYTVTEVEAGKDGYRTASTGASGEITLSGERAAFVNIKEALPQTGAAGGSTIWAQLLLLLTSASLMAAGLFLALRRRSGRNTI